MKVTPFVRGAVTAAMLIVAMRWGEKHPRSEPGIVSVKIDVERGTILPIENPSSFTINQVSGDSHFVFPRDTRLYTIQFCARPGPKTPEAIFRKIDNEALASGQ